METKTPIKELTPELRAITGKPLKRTFTLTRENPINKDTRTVDLSFSSETDKVKRYFGVEILSHEVGAVNLERLNNSAPVLFNHNLDAHLGVVEAAVIDLLTKRGRATVRFGNSELANEKFTDVQDGVLVNVSVSYSVDAAEDTGAITEDGLPIIRITKWTPLEISLCTVPADDSVGVGRTIENLETVTPGKPNEVVEIRTESVPAQPISTQSTISISSNDNPNRGSKKMEDLQRTKEVLAIADAWENQIPEAKLMSRKAIEDKTEPAEFGRQLLDVLKTKQATIKPVSNIGLSEKETRKYDVMKVMRSLADGIKLDGLEAEAHEELCKRSTDAGHGGVRIPYEIQKRTTITVGGTGTYLVADQLQPQSFVDLVYAQSMIQSLGATTLTGLVGNISIPRLTTGTSAGWVAEDGTTAASAAVFGTVSISPKTINAKQPISRQLLKQSTPSVEQVIMRNLAQSVADVLDVAITQGLGTSNQPAGLAKALTDASVSEVTSTSFTYAKALAYLTALQNSNTYRGNLKFLMTPTVAAIIAAKFTNATYGSNPILDMATGKMVGSNVIISPNVKAGHMFYSNFQDLIVADFGNLELAMETDASNQGAGTKLLMAWYDADLAVTRPSSFAWTSSVTA